MKKNIILLAGRSGVGKSLFSEILLDLFLNNEECAKIIYSYTTRKPRFHNEQGHIFVSDEEYDSLDGVKVAETIFDDKKYCALLNQFDADYNIYIVDKKGVYDTLNYSDDFNIFLLEIKRDESMISLTRKDRECLIDYNDLHIDYTKLMANCVFYNDTYSVKEMKDKATQFYNKIINRGVK